MDYRETIYNEPNSKLFKNKTENVQYEVYIARNDSTEGTSWECLNHRLCLESLWDQQ